MANQDVLPARTGGKAPAATRPDGMDPVPEGDVTNYSDSSIDPYTNSYDQDGVDGEGIDEPLGIPNRQHISRAGDVPTNEAGLQATDLPDPLDSIRMPPGD